MGSGVVGESVATGEGTQPIDCGVDAGGEASQGLQGQALCGPGVEHGLQISGNGISNPVCGNGGDLGDVPVERSVAGGQASDTNMVSNQVLGDGYKAGVGHVLNLTTGQVSEVWWPDYPALFEAAGTKVFRVTFFSEKLQQWLSLVPRRSASADSLEVEPADIARIRELQQNGMSEIDSFKRVLGI